ncbi:diguanylate cyclase [Alcaligenaceae bacterium SJ-26]|nr:diguanylate cyclase [Alcaligenaceae bacterium SJ-26]
MNILNWLQRITLRHLMLLLAIASALIVFSNTLYASFLVQRNQLISATLEANQAYASKLASSTDMFLRMAQQQLAYASTLVRDRMSDTEFLQAEVDRLRSQTNSFNSVGVVDALGRVLAISPESLELKGKVLVTPGTLLARREQRALITDPYMSAVGNLVINLVYPIHGERGRYLGFIGGTIRLKEKNILHELLGSPSNSNGSNLYVVDHGGRIIYHADQERIGEQAVDNPVVSAVTQGKAGAQTVINSHDEKMLAGYAHIDAARWGVVAQQPVESTLTNLGGLMLDVLLYAIPPVLLTLVLAWWLARVISRPLWRMANQMQREDDTESAIDRIRNIYAWYFEAAQMRKALLKGMSYLQRRIGKLNLDAQTDPMTGLLNRRAREETLAHWQDSEQTFAVVVLDIDHFKRVNDTYGHDVGDQVIVQLAQIMRASSRGQDRLFRLGGEEFQILLPDTSQDIAQQVAERLRQAVASYGFPGVGELTISLGVAHFPGTADDVALVMKQADQALYAAKSQGRNQVVSVQPQA